MAAFSPKSFEPFQCGHHPTFPPNLITGGGSKSVACLLTFGQLFVYFSPLASLALVVSQLFVCLHLVSCLFTLEAVLAQLPASQSISCSGLSGRGISVNSFLRHLGHILLDHFCTYSRRTSDGIFLATLSICAALFLGPFLRHSLRNHLPTGISNF